MTTVTAKKTILVIDDDADFTTSVQSLLEAEGYEVETADSGREGLRKLVELRPSLVLLDIMMETDTEGYSVNETIKFSDEYQTVQDIPIIMVSSIQETPDQRFPRAPEVDMIRPDRYVTKPLDIPQFLDLVQRAVRR